MGGAGRIDAAMVLCAGLGTRLRPLTDEMAKPMVPVGDRPAVAHVVAQVRLAVPSRIVVNVHHRPADVRAWAEVREPLEWQLVPLGRRALAALAPRPGERARGTRWT